MRGSLEHDRNTYRGGHLDGIPFHMAGTAELIDEAKAGGMFVLVDDECRENEGDLVIPAQFATPDAINFMARYARGLICLAITRNRAGRASFAIHGPEQSDTKANSVYRFYRG